MSLPFERYICRIVDAREGLHVGTAVLVSHRGGEFGYALTCWHNFDPRHQLRIAEDTQIEGVFLIPNADPVEAPEHRRPVIVVADWSNVHMDFAVLKIPRAVIRAFNLHPMPITSDLRIGMRLKVIGFERPGHLLHPGTVSVEVVALDRLVRDEHWNTDLCVFEVTSVDRRAVPYDSGMSGGAMIDTVSRALVGLAQAVAPNETGSHRSLGYGVSIETIARSWTAIDKHCRVKRTGRWRWWVQRAALGVVAAAALAAALILHKPELPRDCRASNVGKRSPDTRTFSVHKWYGPSGKIGDTGDLLVGKGDGQDGGDRFQYQTRGVGPRRGTDTYRATMDTNLPARFAGVTYLSPANCWGLRPDCGYDLRKFSRLHWDARSANALMPTVEFFIGTDNQTWRHVNGVWQATSVPCPGTVSTQSFGTYTLSHVWRTFDFELAPAQDRSRVIGGFGWRMKWEENGIVANGSSPREAKTFVIEIRNIRYEK